MPKDGKKAAFARRLFYVSVYHSGIQVSAGGNGGGGSGYCFGGAPWATQADVRAAVDQQTLISKLDQQTYGIADATYALSGAIKDCCCTTNRNIDAVRFDMSKGFCDVAGAIHAEGEATRALINANTMQALRDKLEDKDRELMTANFQLSQQAQNAYLINEIRPCAKPAYITCSPYTTAGFCGCNA